MLRLLILIGLSLLAWPARADWYEASSKHFVVYSDDRPERVRDYATRLEKFDKAFRVLRDFPDDPVSPSTRVTVYVVDDFADVRRLAGLGRRVGGFYIPRASGSLAFVPRSAARGEAEHILLHEYTHHLMLTRFAQSALPEWLVEGFAEFHATAKFLDDGSVQFGTPPVARAYGLLSGNPLPLSRLLQGDVRENRPMEREAIYGRGWLLTHYLTFNTPRAGQLDTYLNGINNGAASADAAQAFGDLTVLGRELDGYLRQRRISVVTVAPDRLQIEPVTLRKLTPGEAATMDVRIRSTRGVNPETAPAVLAAARRAAAPYPGDAGAQRVLAEAEYDVGNHAEAAAAADRAIAADPTRVDAHVYRGMAAMQIAQANTDATEADWAGVRRWFLAANRIEPEAPMPLMFFYRSFVLEGRPPTDNAIAALMRAQELAPHDLGLRVEAAMAAIQTDRLELASGLLRPVAYSPHGAAVSGVARQMLDLLQSGSGAEALAVARRTRGSGADDEADEGTDEARR